MTFAAFRVSIDFQPDRILRPLQTATIPRLYQAGFRIRRRARSLLKYGQRSSPRGAPPMAHRFPARRRKAAQPFSPLRELTFFAVIPDKWTTIVGPALMPGGRRGDLRKIEEERPWMRPAFHAELPQLPALWADAISN